MKEDIVPYFDSLIDGQYIVFQPRGYKKFKLLRLKKAYSKKDTTKVSLTFNIQNGLKNGLARWYSPKGMVVMEGEYQNDHKTGLWKVYNSDGELVRTAEFKKGLREGLDIFWHDGDTVCVVNYLNDEIHGEVRVFYSNRLAFKGNYDHTYPNATWIYYYPNGNLAKRFTYRDSLGAQIIPFLYRRDLEEKFEYALPPSLLIPDSIRRNTKQSFFSLLDSLNIDDFQIYVQNPSQFHGRYERYNLDGKPIDNLEFEYGYLTREPNLYDEQGRIVSELEVTQKSDSVVLAKRTEYEYDLWYKNKRRRTTKEVLYWKNKSLLQSIEYCRAPWKERKKDLANEYVEYKFYQSYFDSIQNRDTVVLTDYTIKDGLDTVYSKRIHLQTGYNVDKAVGDILDDKGNVVANRTATYHPETKQMKMLFKEFARSGNVAWWHYSTYEQGTSRLDSTIIMYNNKPYSGKAQYIAKRRKKGKTEMIGNVLTIYSEQLARQGEFLNGKFHGKWVNTNKKGTYKRIIHYKNDKRHGTAEYWLTKTLDSEYLKDNAKKYGIKGRKIEYLAASRKYDNGRLDSIASEYYWNGQCEFEGEFAKGRLNGKFTEWDLEGNPLKETSYRNDTLHGLSRRWSRYTGKLISEINYQNGKNHGVYKLYDRDGNPTSIGQTAHDCKVGTWKTYYDDAILKAEIVYSIEDSITAQESKDVFDFSMYSEYTLGNVKNATTSESSGSNWEPGKYQSPGVHNFGNSHVMVESSREKKWISGNDPGKYTFYFKTGEVARTGKIKDYVRSGIWKIWNEGGTLVKEINYEPGEYIYTRKDGTTDTIYHYGTYKSWHSGGNIEVEGLILSEYNDYDCYQEVEIAIQDLFYINFWDDQGNQKVKNGNGYLFLYNRSARPTSEGYVVNGARHGLWKFRDKEGRLTEIGHFVNGKKDGKWYEGDLEGLHFVDNACFDLSNEAVKEKLDYEKNVLNVTIIYYDMDVRINTVSYVNNTNEKPLKKKFGSMFRRRNFEIVDF